MNSVLIILRVFPLVLTAVKAVEDAIPLPGQGRKKLDLVLDVLKQAFDASEELSRAFTFEKLLAVVVPMIAKIVELNNALGLFQKSTPSPSKA